MPPLAQNLQLYMMLAVGAFITVLTILVPLFFAAYYFFQKFATKVELAAAEDRLMRVETHLREQIQLSRVESAGENASIVAEIRALNNSVQLWVNENTRQIAHLEGEAAIIKQISIQHQAPANV